VPQFLGAMHFISSCGAKGQDGARARAAFSCEIDRADRCGAAAAVTHLPPPPKPLPVFATHAHPSIPKRTPPASHPFRPIYWTFLLRVRVSVLPKKVIPKLHRFAKSSSGGKKIPSDELCARGKKANKRF
jgi:hypothetical protein